MSSSSASSASESPDLSPEWVWCFEILPRVSRTFALSIGALPDTLREPVCLAYLLCRVVDTVEDQAGLQADQRVILFDEFDQILAQDDRDPQHFEQLSQSLGLDADGASGELCAKAGIVFRLFRGLPPSAREAIRPSVAEMSSGMREYCARSDREGSLGLRDIDDLDRYCYFVAGTVGKLLTALFEQSVPGMEAATLEAIRSRAVSFGLGLQLVNILKNVAEDLERGLFFLPLELAEAQGVQPKAILEPTERSRGMAVVRIVSARAREHLVRASEYTLLWPGDTGQEIRLFCAVPLGLALATLHEIDHGEDTLVRGREPKLTREAVHRIFGEVLSAVDSSENLRAVLDRCSRGEYR